MNKIDWLTDWVSEWMNEWMNEWMFPVIYSSEMSSVYKIIIMFDISDWAVDSTVS